MKEVLKDLMTAAIGAALVASFAGCQVIDSIPTEWKAAGLSAAADWVVELFTGE